MYNLEIIDNNTYWKEKIQLFKSIDVYYSYEYGQLFASVEGGELLAAYLERGNTKLFYPFIKRSVPLENDIYCYDIITPYGYGGPHIEGVSQDIVEDFYSQFKVYCISNNIISETIRCHPLTRNYLKLSSNLEVKYIRQTTAVDLREPLTDISNNYSPANKRNIKKAEREGVTCFQAEPTIENINLFIDLYTETMNRNQAGSYYFFEKKYFYEQMKETMAGKTYLLFASLNNEVIAAVMVIIGKNYAHYHLGASRTSCLYLRPNNLLFDYMIKFSKSKGTSFLHLGGGYEENDGLFKFKTSFTNNNNYKYFIGTQIYNEDLYKKIVKDVETKYFINENYFPVYRGILAPKEIQLG
ncbi:GNAT family N-acetyltransferase [Evansella sp. LMS18]|uniref:lipid II:glycine glycyltransferase FemX n=1 Tax=Evansella sp. LMS18 TaxID=2924033 RepID=UPI0020D13E88|nr:GNAT family N-acetyltransferase [Evansella sp. LMS18]UTR10568.1 GNAT family N-acetyltransferase [Evansella sp. LMS18]